MKHALLCPLLGIVLITVSLALVVGVATHPKRVTARGRRLRILPDCFMDSVLKSPSSRLRWEDGRTFAPKVDVNASNGCCLWHAHAAQARQMCKAGIAVVDVVDRHRIRSIVIVHTPPAGSRVGNPTLGCVNSSSTIHLEVLGYDPEKGRLALYQFWPASKFIL